VTAGTGDVLAAADAMATWADLGEFGNLLRRIIRPQRDRLQMAPGDRDERERKRTITRKEKDDEGRNEV